MSWITFLLAFYSSVGTLGLETMMWGLSQGLPLSGVSPSRSRWVGPASVLYSLSVRLCAGETIMEYS